MPAKSLARKKAAPKKAATKTKAIAKKAVRGKSGTTARKPAQAKPRRGTSPFSRPGPAARSGEQSGDLQGLSNLEAADSESVDELLEEGNAFEAGVVAGVEDAGHHDEREVRTREVPEDDVPGEYLDEE